MHLARETTLKLSLALSEFAVGEELVPRGLVGEGILYPT